MELNQMTKKLRDESYILTPRARDAMNFFIHGDKDFLKQRIEERLGRKDGLIMTEKNQWLPAIIPYLKTRLEEIEKEFRNYQQSSINTGQRRPDEMPPHLEKDYVTYKARLTVAEEEVKYLEKELKKIPGAVKEELPPIMPRKAWGTGVLHGGILQSIGGQVVKPDEKGVLCIADSRSDYDGMEVWKFHRDIIAPMKHENDNRCKAEEVNSLAENRLRRAVSFPPAPQYNKVTKKITYPSYSAKTLDAVKVARAKDKTSVG